MAPQLTNRQRQPLWKQPQQDIHQQQQDRNKSNLFSRVRSRALEESLEGGLLRRHIGELPGGLLTSGRPWRTLPLRCTTWMARGAGRHLVDNESMTKGTPEQDFCGGSSLVGPSAAWREKTNWGEMSSVARKKMTTDNVRPL